MQAGCKPEKEVRGHVASDRLIEKLNYIISREAVYIEARRIGTQ